MAQTKQTQIGKIPEEREVVESGNIVELIKEKGSAGKIPYIEIGDIDIKNKRYFIKDKNEIRKRISSISRKENQEGVV